MKSLLAFTLFAHINIFANISIPIKQETEAIQKENSLQEDVIAKSTLSEAIITGDYNKVISAVAILKKNGTSLDYSENWQGFTPLLYAVTNKRLNILNFLISNGADVNSRTIVRTTPLMAAAGYGYSDITNSLLSHGALMDEQSMNGSTALMQAVRHKKYETAKILLMAGANKSLKDEDGQTALSLAEKNKDIKMLQLLKTNFSKSKSKKS
jgi:ankyrin repeat protein